jgi:hypothetical protein
MFMKMKTTRVGLLLLTVAALGMVSGVAMAQDKVLAEITGNYLLELSSRTIPFKILLQADKLFFDAEMPGQTAQPLTPVEGKTLTYKGLDPNGDEMILAFTKDDKGKITGCNVSLPSRGIEAKATKTEVK